MAKLSDADRQQLANEFMRNESNVRRETKGLKADQRSAVDAVDDWWDTRETGFLNSLPQPAIQITDEQKIALIIEVLKKRIGI